MLHVDGIELGRHGCQGRRAWSWRGRRGLGEHDSLLGDDLLHVIVFNEVRGQKGERERAWPVAVHAFRRPAASGVAAHHYCELFQQLQSKVVVSACVSVLCVCCVREREGNAWGFQLIKL